MDSEENQPNTGRGYNNSPGLGGNLVQEGNEQYENEQGLDQFQQDPNQISPNEKFQPIGSDHSFHLDKKFDNFAKNEKFNQKRKKSVIN